MTQCGRSRRWRQRRTGTNTRTKLASGNSPIRQRRDNAAPLPPHTRQTMRLFSRSLVPMTCVLAAAALLAGCAAPATTDDAAVTFDTAQPVAPESLQDRALEACRAQGKQRARFESQMNADARLPAGQGTQLNTFICR